MSVLYRSHFLSAVMFLMYAAVVPAPAATAECGASAASEFLNSRLSFWQQRLKLQEWSLSVVSSHPTDLKPETLGNIHWDRDKKTAVVRVLALSDYKLACRAALADMELTVVHELVHLTLSPLRNAATDRGDEEQAVNRIADALLRAERQH